MGRSPCMALGPRVSGRSLPHHHDGGSRRHTVRWVPIPSPCRPLAFTLPSATQADLPPAPALLLLGLTNLLVIKRLILLVVRLNERIISPIRKGEAIPIAEVAIDRRHLTFALDVSLLGHISVIEQDIHHKRPIGSAARCIG